MSFFQNFIKIETSFYNFKALQSDLEENFIFNSLQTSLPSTKFEIDIISKSSTSIYIISTTEITTEED